jgi:iron uptake system component EfeO
VVASDFPERFAVNWFRPVVGRRACSPIHAFLLVYLLSAVGCGADGTSDAQFKSQIVSAMHQLVLSEVVGLNQAASDLQAAAPAPVGRGWDATLDQQPIADMKDAWVRMRANWEQAEGTLECLFPDLDTSMDSRYEELLAPLGATGDPDPFDGVGITGMHAVERILYAPVTPLAVIAYESSLAGSLTAAWPATEAEAADFKGGLCQRLVTDTQTLLDDWKPLAVDLPAVFQGITGLMSAQTEKVGLAVQRREESRYSQMTMADLRFNLAGTQGIYDLFQPWLGTKAYGTTLDNSATTALTGLAAIYATVVGDAIPPPPDSWNSAMPSLSDQQSPFGQLYEAVVQEVDPSRSGSAVEAMNQVAKALGLPAFTGQTCGQ